MNYYNEIDPFAAAWLRELIKAGHIAQGEVDERSIEDVVPSDLRGFKQCHFFAGIGVWSYALRLAGWPDDREVWTGSCPCQPFSAAGKRGGTADERHLWPAFFHLISQCKPVVVFGEQVASKDGLAWLDTVQADLEGAGYAVGAADTCAAGFGAPHIRQRLHFVANSSIERRQQERGSASGYEEAHGREGWDRSQSHSHYLVGGKRETGIVAHSLRAGRPQGWPIAGDRQATSLRSDNSVEHATCEQVGLSRRSREPRSADGELGHADNTGPQGRQFSGDSPSERFAGEAGLVNGFWRDAEWLYCRDDKYRPVEPGTFPLAHGVANRVGRLRGYGNAIVAPQAAAFVSAAMECL